MTHNFGSEKRTALLLATAFMGMMLVLAPIGARATIINSAGGSQFSVINSTPGTVFRANATQINGTTSYNFVGSGGNNTFILAVGNFSTTFLATGLKNNTFIINSTGGGNSTFSLSSGANSTFLIQEGNLNGTLDANGALITALQQFAITGGANCRLNESSFGPVSNAIWSVNLGANSTVSLGSVFVGNETIINIVF